MEYGKCDGEGARTSGCNRKKEDRHNVRARNQMKKEIALEI